MLSCLYLNVWTPHRRSFDLSRIRHPFISHLFFITVSFTMCSYIYVSKSNFSCAGSRNPISLSCILLLYISTRYSLLYIGNTLPCIIYGFFGNILFSVLWRVPQIYWNLFNLFDLLYTNFPLLVSHIASLLYKTILLLKFCINF